MKKRKDAEAAAWAAHDTHWAANLNHIGVPDLIELTPQWRRTWSHTLLDERGGIELLKAMQYAETEHEWRMAVSRIVRFLLLEHHPTPADPKSNNGFVHMGFVMWANAVAASIANGPAIAAKRPSGRLQALYDAQRIRYLPSLADAIAELRWLSEIAPGALPRAPKATERALRQRVERAEKFGGFRLRRSPPFAKKA